jgi:aminoglycoside phosphotransferase (APT) family kinase protein
VTDRAASQVVHTARGSVVRERSDQARSHLTLHTDRVKSCNRAYEDLVRVIVARVFGTPSFVLKPVPTYPDSIVYEATSTERSVVFKSSDPDGEDPDGIELEAWALEAARQQDVPVPRVEMIDTSATAFPCSYMMMEKVGGLRFDEAGLPQEVRDRLILECGAALRRLHAVELEGFGRLDDEVFSGDRKVRGWSDSWRQSVLDPLPEAMGYLSGVLSSERHDHLAQVLTSVVPSIEDISDPRLLHGDFGGSHVYVDLDGSQIMGVVDFGERASGHWLWDFCEWDLASMDTLRRGYGAVEVDFDVSLDRYLLIKAVPWAAKWHRRGEPQVLEWLAITTNRVDDA